MNEELNQNRFTDLGVAIRELIKSYLSNNVSTSFLAKVNSINEDNTVDIQPLFNNQIIPKIKVAMISTKEFKLSMKVAKDDLGIAIVSKYDISPFMNGEYKITYPRLFNIQDCIFIPISFQFDSKENNLLKSVSENISIDSGNKIVLKNKTQSLAKLIDEFIDTITAFKSTNAAVGSPVACGPDTIQSLAELKLKFKELLDE